MQFSESWLRSLCNPALSTDELCHLLTMAGLEVEERRAAGADFSGVVVAEVLSVGKHPDADKLKLCSVNVGESAPLQIVCGAPNVAAGMKVPCARVGARLPGCRASRSNRPGCAASRASACSARHANWVFPTIMAVCCRWPPMRRWARTSAAISISTITLITLKLTPNRADCLSLLGIARELSALTGAPLLAPEVKPVAAVVADTRQVVLDAPASCSRYCGRIIRGVDARAATPEWMKRRIERSGIRAISFLVDVTNYVMLELGQPLHAFDDAELSGAIHVRLPESGEKLLLLNEQTVTPTADTALIADDEKPLAMAGVMGGEHSGINDATCDLFLESAFFPPAAIAGKARALGFSSDASHRYERGVDFDLQRKAIERATQLIVDTCGGRPGPVVEAVSAAHLPARKPVRLRTARAARVLGIVLAAGRIESILTGLGLSVERQGDGFPGHAAVLPFRYRNRGRPDRGNRPRLRLRQYPVAAARGTDGHDAGDRAEPHGHERAPPGGRP